MPRTQITLTQEQYARLRDLSRDTGQSMSELVRRALDRTYAARAHQALAESFGAWRNRRFDGEEYVDRLRSGLAERLEGAGGRAG